ncbi:MAG: MFS transporter [Myxococcota bacterium]|jgi:OPA family glycerol-3-phosphate transporter-like MFS transporter|nr:MFS transporter [Myxococcota bacterium]
MTSGQVAPELRLRHWRIRIFALTWLTYASYYFCRQPFYIGKSEIEKAFDLDPTFLGYLGLTYIVCYDIGQFTAAALGRRLGSRLLLLLGMAATILINVVFGLSNSGMTILLFMALNGLAQGTGWSGVIGTLAMWFRRTERGQVMGIWATCYQVGAIAAKSYAAFLLGLWGWRFAFFGGAALTLVFWVINLFFFRSTPQEAGLPPVNDDDEALARPAAGAAPTTGGRPVREPLGWDRKVWMGIVFLGLTYLCLKFLRYSLWSWGPYLMEKTFHLTGAEAGQHSVAFDVGGFFGVIVSGVVSDRLFQGRRSHTTLIMILGLVAACILMYTVGSLSIWVMTGCFALVGFMLYGPDFLVSGAGAVDVGSQRGALVAAGLISGIGTMGAILQEIAIPIIYERFEHQLLPVLLLFVGVAMLGALAITILWIMGRKGWTRF